MYSICSTPIFCFFTLASWVTKVTFLKARNESSTAWKGFLKKDTACEYSNSIDSPAHIDSDYMINGSAET